MGVKLYDLSNPQKSIWYTEQYYEGTSINNIGAYIHFKECVNFDVLKQAINEVVKSNDNFRLILKSENNKPNQSLCDYTPFDIDIIEVSSEEDIISKTKEFTNVPFIIENNLLFKFWLFKLPNDEGGVIINIHHIISDSWTLGLISKEIAKTYSEMLQNTYKYSKRPSYLEYLKNEKEYLESSRFNKDKEYWKEQFKTIPESISLPSSNNSIKKDISNNSIRKQFKINENLFVKIKDLCQTHNISLYNFFMAIYSIYIGKICNTDDLVLGTPILNRLNPIQKNTMGMFISTIPLRVNLDYNLSFINFIKNIGTNIMSSLRHQKFSYQNILQMLRENNSSISNLYNILISYQITKSVEYESNIKYVTNWINSSYSANELQIHLFDTNDENTINIAYDYLVDKYTNQDILDLHSRIITIINQVLENNNMLLKDIEIVTPNEKNKLLYEFNNTKMDYPKAKTVVNLFEEQVNKTPNNVAVVFENNKLTYKELNEKSNQLARYLLDNNVSTGSILGIMLNRSLEMIVSILAALKTGAAYIPIDPEYPEERIKHIIATSNCKIFITSDSLKSKVTSLGFDGLLVISDFSNTLIYNLPNNNLNINIEQDDLSYLIFTSGSTGTPKGVMLTHKNLNNFIHSLTKKIEYLHDNIYHSIVSITTVSFDIFIFESIVSLCRGLKLFITNDSEQKVSKKLETLILKNNIEILQTTPSIINFHLDNSTLNGFKNLNYIMLAGEPLPKALVSKIKKINPNCTIYNGYGPSETTIFSSVVDVTNCEEITIGKPIGNTQFYILNDSLSLLPINTLGEIYISGDGVGKGYINRLDLTNERYILNPFSENSIMYKTGDLGFWDENGNIVCKGRSDNQIKLRGLRIELGEIENCINSYDVSKNIKSTVLVKNIDSAKCLVAFVSSNTKINEVELRHFIKDKLPTYMLPSYYVFLDKLPLTPNGKIDKNILKTYDFNKSILDSNHTPARNLTEQLLINSIKKKLDIENFGIDDNIFNYGADSLSIINILTDLFQYDISLKVYDFYKNPTVREIYDNVIISEKNSSLDTNKLLHTNSIVSKFEISANCKKISDKKSVILTGSTGFFGIHILAELLNNTSKIKKVFCFIREKHNISIRERLLNNLHFYFGTRYDDLYEKYVVCINSDMLKDSLGLSEEDYALIKKEADLVIHCAANVKHYGDYSTFKLINIEGTNKIIELCKVLNIPLHYISTMTISGNYLLEQKNTSEAIFNESSFYLNQDFSNNVYSKSKLIAESLVIDSINQGLSASIYRIGDLSGRYDDGQFQKNISENAIYSRLKSIIEIGAIPDTILDNYLEFTPVDFASRALINIIWSNNHLNRIYHLYNPNMIKTKDLIAYMEQLNYNIKPLPQNLFLELVHSISTNPLTQSKITGIINDFTKNNDLIYNHIITINNDITCKYLYNLDFKWSTLNFEYFSKLIKYMQDVNFLN